MGSSYVYYERYNNEQKVINEANKLVDIIELAKKKASVSDIGTYTCSDFQGTQISFVSPGYMLNLCCLQNCAAATPLDTYTLQSNIDIQTTGPTSISFKKYIDNMVVSGALSLKVRNSAIGSCVPITISSIGTVSIKKPCVCTDISCT